MNRGRGLGAVAAAALTGCALAGCALAGCTGGRPHPGATRTAPAPDASLNAIVVRFVQCVRSHGIPDFPDVAIVDGAVQLPASLTRRFANNRPALDACRPILGQLPASMLEQSEPPLTDQQIQQRRRYAECMRQHGVPEWPDPDPDGHFRPEGTLAGQLKSARVLAAMQACQRYEDAS